MSLESCNEKLCQSYVFGRFGDYFVSTALRKNNAVSWYETFVWKFINGKVDEFAAVMSDVCADSSRALKNHFYVVEFCYNNVVQQDNIAVAKAD